MQNKRLRGLKKQQAHRKARSRASRSLLMHSKSDQNGGGCLGNGRSLDCVRELRVLLPGKSNLAIWPQQNKRRFTSICLLVVSAFRRAVRLKRQMKELLLARLVWKCDRNMKKEAQACLSNFCSEAFFQSHCRSLKQTDALPPLAAKERKVKQRNMLRRLESKPIHRSNLRVQGNLRRELARSSTR